MVYLSRPVKVELEAGGYGAHNVGIRDTDNPKVTYLTEKVKEPVYMGIIEAKATATLRLKAEQRNKLHPIIHKRIKKYEKYVSDFSDFVKKVHEECEVLTLDLQSMLFLKIIS